MSDYPQAIDYFVDASRVFIGENSHSALVIHGTGGSATQTAQQLGDYFRTTPLETSVHYGVDRAGVICQYVSEADGAGGNCCVEAGHDTFWDQFGGDNLNKHTLSIECENDAENSLSLSTAQQATVFALIAHLCKKYSIAPDHIKSHASIAPVTRARCPGANFPWSALWAYLKGVTMTEVCSVTDTSQFETGKTVDACGFFSISLLMHAGRPGQASKGTAADIAAWADAEYTKYEGADTSSNERGMTVAVEYEVVNDAGLHYQGIGAMQTGLHTDHLTADYVRAWLKLGYPVLLAVAESAVFDLDLNGSPYAWNTTGLSHVITATGFDGSALLCHDTASISPNGVRPGPRHYDAGKLQQGMISATAVMLPWLARPNPDFDPIEEASMFHFLTIAEQKDYFVQTKAGHDDSWTCTKNKIVMGGAHLNYYRYNGGVETFGLPTSVEVKINAAHPECTAVLYERAVCFYDPHGALDLPADRNVNQPEKRVYRAHIDSGFGFQLIAGGQIAALNAEIVTLETQLKAAQAGPVDATVTALKAQLAQVETLAGEIVTAAKV